MTRPPKLRVKRDGFLVRIEGEPMAYARRASPEALRLSLKLNRLAIKILKCSIGCERDSDYFAGPLFARTLQNFEGAVLLAATGMRVESRTLARSCLESGCYCIAACGDLRDEQGRPFVHQVIGDHERYRRRTVSDLKGMGDFDAEHVRRWEEIVAEMDASISALPPINLRELMAAVGWEGFYTVLFRPLSQDAHPSAESLERHCRFDAAGNLVRFAITIDLIPFADTVAAACAGLLLAIEAYVERFGVAVAAEKATCIELYKALVEANANQALAADKARANATTSDSSDPK